MFMHMKGYLHNDLKGNEVILEGASHMATVIDFAKSKQITKAKLTKPKVSIADAAKRYSTSHLKFIGRGRKTVRR